MKTSSYILFLAAVLATAHVHAQNSNLTQISSSSLASGGGTASAGGYTLTHTLGESFVGNSSGGSYSLTAGFCAQEADSNSVTNVGLQIHAARLRVGMVLTWENPFAVLEEAHSVTGPFTTLPGAMSPHTVSIGSDVMKFYRLRVVTQP